MPEYGRVGNVTPLRLKFDSSVRNGVTTVTLTRPRAFRSSAITVKEYDAEREHNHGPDEERSRPAHTHTHPRRGVVVPGDSTHTRTWHGGARCTVAQVRRPFALPLQSTRHGESSGGVLLQPPTGPSYKRRRTQGAPGRRAVAAASLLRLSPAEPLPGGNEPPPHRAANTAGVRNASAASLECRRRAQSLSYYAARSLHANVLAPSVHGDHVYKY